MKMNTEQTKLLNDLATIVSAHIEIVCHAHREHGEQEPSIACNYQTINPMRASFENFFKQYMSDYNWTEDESLHSLHKTLVNELKVSDYRSTPQGIKESYIDALLSIDTHSLIVQISMQYIRVIYLEGKRSDLEIQDLHYKWISKIIQAAFYPELFTHEVADSKDPSDIRKEPLYGYIVGSLEAFTFRELECRVESKADRLRILKQIRSGLEGSICSLTIDVLNQFDARFSLSTTGNRPTLIKKKN